jgi:hypothetical protein
VARSSVILLLPDHPDVGPVKGNTPGAETSAKGTKRKPVLAGYFAPSSHEPETLQRVQTIGANGEQPAHL